MRTPKDRGAASSTANSGNSEDRAEVVNALLSPNCDASLALVRRTRYVVRDTVMVLEDRRVRQRHNIGLALLVLAAVLILLTPEIWINVEDLLAGENLADLSYQIALLLLMLVPAMLAALAAIWKGHWSTHHDNSEV
jgi:hypothetical protein